MGGHDKLPPWPRLVRYEHNGKVVCDRRTEIRVGVIVFQYDQNVRIYPRSGPVAGRADERHHYVAALVKSETRVSWVLDNGAKVPKKDPKTAFGRFDVDEAVWLAENRHKLTDLIWSATYLQLQQVAAVLNYKPGEEA